MKNKLIKLEALRGFAAFYVVLHHTVHKVKIFEFDVSFIFKFGQEAVILFFMLSGFVIEYSFSRGKDKSFKTYFIKRFLRIYIPLIFVFIASYFICTMQNENKLDWKVLVGNILMFQDIDTLKPNVVVPTFLGNSPLWSLSYEWWFYMLYFPISCRLRNKSSLVVYTLGIMSAITYIIIPNFINRELMYLTIWWTGVEMAKLYVQNNSINIIKLKQSLTALLIITAILCINVIFSENISTIGVHPLLELRHFGFSVFAIFTALIWKNFAWFGFSSIVGIFSHFAPISYGVYVSHFFLISNATYLNDVINNSSLRFVLYCSICIVFAYLIERVIYISINRLVFNKISEKIE